MDKKKIQFVSEQLQLCFKNSSHITHLFFTSASFDAPFIFIPPIFLLEGGVTFDVILLCLLLEFNFGLLLLLLFPTATVCFEPLHARKTKTQNYESSNRYWSFHKRDMMTITMRSHLIRNEQVSEKCISKYIRKKV